MPRHQWQKGVAGPDGRFSVEVWPTGYRFRSRSRFEPLLGWLRHQLFHRGDFSVIVLEQRRLICWRERVVELEHEVQLEGGLTEDQAVKRAQQLAAQYAASDIDLRTPAAAQVLLLEGATDAAEAWDGLSQ
jgi:hypothetical protein